MITTDDAHRIATQVIGPATATDGQGWHLEEFDAGWLVREDWMSQESVRGGSFCVIEKAAGQVLAFPSSISPTRIMTEYDQVVDRASPYPTNARQRLIGNRDAVAILLDLNADRANRRL